MAGSYTTATPNSPASVNQRLSVDLSGVEESLEKIAAKDTSVTVRPLVQPPDVHVKPVVQMPDIKIDVPVPVNNNKPNINIKIPEAPPQPAPVVTYHNHAPNYRPVLWTALTLGAIKIAIEVAQLLHQWGIVRWPL